jgi:hypothetical protein
MAKELGSMKRHLGFDFAMVPKAEQHLGTMRQLMTLSYPPLQSAAREAASSLPKGQPGKPAKVQSWLDD